MEVSGYISAKSEAGATMAMSRRILGGQPWMTLLCGSVAAAFGFLGAGGLQALMPDEPIGALSLLTSALIMLGAIVGLSQIQHRGLVRAWADRGVVYPSRQTVQITDDGLRLSCPLIDLSSPWAGVTEVSRSPDGWVIVLIGTGVSVPSSFFEGQDAERAFVRALLERMSDAARERSKAATDFIGVWG